MVPVTVFVVLVFVASAATAATDAAAATAATAADDAAITVDASVPAAFDRTRLRALVAQRLANDPLIEPTCTAPLVIAGDAGQPAALAVRILDDDDVILREATIAPAEAGVMELELVRNAVSLMRAVCPAQTPRTIVAVDDGGAPDGGVTSSAPFVAHNRAALMVGALGRASVGGAAGAALPPSLDVAVLGDASRSVFSFAGVELEIAAALGAVGSSGTELVAAELLFGGGPAVSGALFGGRARVVPLVGGRVHSWIGTQDGVPGGTRADFFFALPVSWTVDVAGVRVGASAAPFVSQQERELRLFDAILWQRAAPGVLVGLQIGTPEAMDVSPSRRGNILAPGA
jgi:hypothetical protein